MGNLAVKSVVKRDGRIVPFDPSRIERAIWKAMEATKHGSPELAKKLAGEVVKEIEEKFFSKGKIPHVEEIQDLVEKTLVKHDLYEVAKAYIIYRRQRTELRTIKHILGVKDDLKLSLNAIAVLRARYLLKDETGRIIETPRQMFMRVARYVGLVDALYWPEVYDKEGRQPPRQAEETNYRPERANLTKYELEMLRRLYNRLGREGKMRKSFKEVLRLINERWDELYKNTIGIFYKLMVNRLFLPNSPTLMNAGAPLGQLSACFVIPIEDSIESIMDAVKYAAIIHKTGGGTGFSFSRLRPKGDIVRTTGGAASGPVSFMRIIDVTTEVIKQGGKRRGANMGVLRFDHPDIMEFIHAKADGGFRNFNISVAVTDEFMKAVENDGYVDLINPRTGKPVAKVKARHILDAIVYNAWRTGDPGLLFIDRINKHNPTPNLGQIEATNPCVTGDTLIPTEKGLVTIRELATDGGPVRSVVDLRVLYRDGGDRGLGTAPTVLIAFKTGRRKVVELETKKGFRVKLTEDHSVLTPRGWMPAGALKPGDAVYIQSGYGIFSSDRKLPFKPLRVVKAGSGRLFRFNLPDEWSWELGFVLGWLVGDGYISSSNHVGFCFGRDEGDVLDKVKGIIDGWRVAPPVVLRRDTELELTYHSKYLSEFFERLGVKKVKAPEKEVPASLFKAPEEAVRGFLNGLFSADGTVLFKDGKSAEIRLSSTSLKLLRQVQLLLLNLGIVSRIYRERRRGGGFTYIDKKGRERVYLGKPWHELVISRENVVRFLSLIGLTGRKHQGKVKLLLDKAKRKRGYYRELFKDVIASVRQAGEEEVYDVKEPLTHSFIGNGFVLHNCGEQPLLPFESCNLGSINLSLMVRERDGKLEVDWEKLREVVRVAVHFLDNVIDANKYPVPEIERATLRTRKIGLGVMGWAELLFKLKIPYGSEEALNLARRVMEYINYHSKLASIELARERGSFPAFKGSIYDGDRPRMPFEADDEEKRYTMDWDRVRKLVKKHGIRNAATTTIAPTGTISIIAGTTSGIEPVFALSYVRTVLEGVNMFETNQVFREEMEKRGLWNEEFLREVTKTGSIQHIPGIPEELKRVFVTALDLPVEWHVKMQAAFQEFTDNAVSKTINLRYDATPEDVRKAFMLAWKLKCKGITVYRYGSKGEQVLYVGVKPPEERRFKVAEEALEGCPRESCKL